MCELFGASLREEEEIKGYLSEFFSHGTQHPHGWGIFFFDYNEYKIVKEAFSSAESQLVQKMIKIVGPQKHFLAHIRLATAGAVKIQNCHPFSKKDDSGRCWTLIHNGTIYSVYTIFSLLSRLFPIFRYT